MGKRLRPKLILKQAATALKQLLLPGLFVVPAPKKIVLPICVKPNRNVHAQAVELNAIWEKLRLEYFPEAQDLSTYKVFWSKRRQRRTLASCNIKKKKIVVASELKYDALQIWWEPLIFHEMCHAVLGHGIKRFRQKTPWHGQAFKDLERRHPKSHALKAWIKSGGWERATRNACL